MFPHRMSSAQSQPSNQQHNTNSETYISTRSDDNNSRSDIFNKSDAGLSKFHQRLLTSNTSRQRFVTGKYPLYISIRDSPTRKWLGQLARLRGAFVYSNNVACDAHTIFCNFLMLYIFNVCALHEYIPQSDQTTKTSTSQVFINGTLVELSTASFDKWGWLDDDGKDDLQRLESSRTTTTCSLELIAEIHTRKPCYVNLLPKFSADSDEINKSDILWVTDFSLTRPSGITSLDMETASLTKLQSLLAWPNEVSHVPTQCYSPPFSIKSEVMEEYLRCTEDFDDGQGEDALLVTDGFLVPGRDDGGVYVIRRPGSEHEWKACLCGNDETGWFYHRYVKLPCLYVSLPTHVRYYHLTLP